MDESYILSSASASTMALLFDYPVKKEHRVVLIEWVDPHPSLSSFQDTERETRIKTLMLATPKPAQLLLPTCYGMVEDSYTRRFGLVLAPPTHIRSGLPSILPAGAISKKRMPVSLKELMDKRHPACVKMLELGTRFSLARRVVGAVWGWFCVGVSFPIFYCRFERGSIRRLDFLGNSSVSMDERWGSRNVRSKCEESRSLAS